jgi:hypothetical protein
MTFNAQKCAQSVVPFAASMRNTLTSPKSLSQTTLPSSGISMSETVRKPVLSELTRAVRFQPRQKMPTQGAGRFNVVIKRGTAQSTSVHNSVIKLMPGHTITLLLYAPALYFVYQILVLMFKSATQ